MKKKFLFVMSMLTFLVSGNVNGGIIPLNPGFGDERPIIVIPTKGPNNCPQVDITDHVFTSTELSSCSYTLVLEDAVGNVVYSHFVSEGISQVIIPSTITGDFVLLIQPENSDNYYFGFCSL